MDAKRQKKRALILILSGLLLTWALIFYFRDAFLEYTNQSIAKLVVLPIIPFTLLASIFWLPGKKN